MNSQQSRTSAGRRRLSSNTSFLIGSDSRPEIVGDLQARDVDDCDRNIALHLAQMTLSERPQGEFVGHFTFTCARCGARCTLDTPNVLYERGECWRCGAVSAIVKASFMIVGKQRLGGVDGAARRTQ